MLHQALAMYDDIGVIVFFRQIDTVMVIAERACMLARRTRNPEPQRAPKE
jgi:hypothetical protein